MSIITELYPDEDWARRWPNFSKKELACRCCGVLKIDEDFLCWLQDLRRLFAYPMIITSGYRCPKNNKGRGPAHALGKAVDVNVYGIHTYLLVDKAMARGVRGLGVNQKGELNQRFIHLDMLDDGEGGAPRPRIWSY